MKTAHMKATPSGLHRLRLPKRIFKAPEQLLSIFGAYEHHDLSDSMLTAREAPPWD